MTRVPIDVTATERARWLAELSEALEQAERLVWSLGDRPGVAPELKELYGRLDAARRGPVPALQAGRHRPVE